MPDPGKGTHPTASDGLFYTDAIGHLTLRTFLLSSQNPPGLGSELCYSVKEMSTGGLAGMNIRATHSQPSCPLASALSQALHHVSGAQGCTP